MASRQIHIDNIDQIRNGVAKYLNRKVNIVLKDNTVQFGELLVAGPSGLEIRNMRQKKIFIPIESVCEIYVG